MRERFGRASRPAHALLALTLLACGAPSPAPAPAPAPAPSPAPAPAPAPSPAPDWELVRTLASDALEGRAPGSEGGRKARAAIIAELERCGLKPAFGTTFEQKTDGPGVNVAAHLPGTETGRHIVLSAHYDHLGVHDGEIMNGADDNAAGVGSVVRTACNLARTTRPHKVTLIVALWDAEEPPHFLSPTMGSRYWVEHPHVPLASVEAAIVLDLVGAGMWPGSPVHVALGAESSPTLAKAVADTPVPPGLVVGQAGLHLVEHLVVNPDGHVQPWSDYHYFRESNVPALFLSNGQSPRYHTAGDDFASLDLAKLSRQTTWLTALVAHLLDLPKDAAPRHAPFERLEDDRAAATRLLEAALASGHFAAHVNVLRSDLALLPSAGARTLRLAVQRLQCLASEQYPAAMCLRLGPTGIETNP